jgi:tetratricopeptide (TPR) repeat protein
LYYASRYDEAIRQYQQTIELEPNNHSAHQFLGDAYEQNGMYGDAIEEWHRAMTLANDGELAAILKSGYAEAGFSNAVQAVALKTLERLNDRAHKGEYVPAIHFARAYVRLDEKEEAIRWLTQSCEERNVYALMIAGDPVYNILRTDPRFIRLRLP